MKYYLKYYLKHIIIGGSFKYSDSVKFIDTDIYIVSYPKSGRTWIRYMLVKYINYLYNVEPKNELDIYGLTSTIEFSKIQFTHDGAACNEFNLHRHHLDKSKNFYKNKHVILIVRDPRDVVVSYFYHCSTRKSIFKGSLSEFIRSDFFGSKKIIDFMNLWYDGYKNDFIFFKYEDFMFNTQSEFSRLLGELNLKIDESLISRVIKEGSFRSMQNLAESGSYSVRQLMPTKKDPNSRKIRKGKIGGYIDEFTKSDLLYANNCLLKLDPIFGYKAE